MTRRSLAVVAILALAGCNGIGTLGESASSGAASMRQTFFGSPQPAPAVAAALDQPEYNCPAVTIMEGGASHRIGRAGTNEVAHQASLVDVARECRFGGGQVTLKVGIQGRMLIGSLGRSGTFTAPLRIAVKRGDEVVTTRVARVTATIPSGDTSAAFVHVEDNIVVPLSARDPADEYDVYVGFDSGGAGDPRKGRRRR